MSRRQILIADDHVMIAEALSLVLQKSQEYEVHIAETFADALAELSQRNFDFILLDLRMPGMGGLPSVNEVLKKAGSAAVLIFSGSMGSHFLKECIALGVRGYLPKSISINAVEIALKLVEAGQIYVPYQPEEENGSAVRGSIEGKNLTQNELEVLKLAAEGETNKGIARTLATTEIQVKMYMRNVCSKLAARNRAHACILARERAII